MTLPSPIPHPVSYLDAQGKWHDVIDLVVGSHWPDGDEKAMRALAAEWREAARRVKPALEEADRASRDAVAGFGGSDSGAALHDGWHGLSFALEVETFERLAELAEAGADIVETAKTDIHAEVSALVGQLENSAGAEAASLVETPSLTGAQVAVELVARRAATRMHELALRPLGDGRPFAFPQLASADLLTSAGSEGTGGASSSISDSASSSFPAAPDGVLVFAAGIASLGGPGSSGGVPGGIRSVTALKGRYGERAIRGPSGTVLSEISIGVIANEGVEWSGLAGGPASPVATPRLAGTSSSVASDPVPVSKPDTSYSSASGSASGSVSGSAVRAGDLAAGSAPAVSATPVRAVAATTGIGVASPGPGATPDRTPLAAANAPTGAAPNATLASTDVGVSTGTAAVQSTAGAVGAAASAPPATSAGSGGASGGAGVSASGGVVPGVPSAGSGGASPVGSSTTSSSGASQGAGAGPGAAPRPGAAGSPAGAVPAGSLGAQGGGAASAGSGTTTTRTRDAAFAGHEGEGMAEAGPGPDPALTSMARNSFTLTAFAQPHDGSVDPAETEPPVVPLLMVAATQEMPPATAAPRTASKTLPDSEMYEKHVLDRLELPEDEAAQQLWRDTVQREEGVAQRAHQQALEQAVERDEAGEPMRFPELMGAWVGLVNAGGPLADRRRATNAAEVALSLVDTWLRGRPRAAHPGTHEEIGELQRLATDQQGLSKLEAALKVQGHGACAIVVQEWPHGEVHATTVHNQRGELVYVDAQRVDQPLSAEPVPGAVRMGVLAFGPEGKRIDIGG